LSYLTILNFKKNLFFFLHKGDATEHSAMMMGLMTGASGQQQQLNYHQLVLLPLCQPCETGEDLVYNNQNNQNSDMLQMGVVGTTSAHAPFCIAYGEGLLRSATGAGLGATALLRGKPTQFIVQTRDHVNEARCQGGDTVLVFVLAPDRHLHRLSADTDNVFDKHDGTYLVTYCPPLDGPYTISVLVNAQHIAASPFHVQVKSNNSELHFFSF
jgi:hypothetical protein